MKIDQTALKMIHDAGIDISEEPTRGYRDAYWFTFGDRSVAIREDLVNREKQETDEEFFGKVDFVIKFCCNSYY